jgi:hypothetical protein
MTIRITTTNILIATIFLVAASSCKKGKTEEPDLQELISNHFKGFAQYSQRDTVYFFNSQTGTNDYYTTIDEVKTSPDFTLTIVPRQDFSVAGACNFFWEGFNIDFGLPPGGSVYQSGLLESNPYYLDGSVETKINLEGHFTQNFSKLQLVFIKRVTISASNSTTVKVTRVIADELIKEP